MNKSLTDQGGTKLISASFSAIDQDGIRMSDLLPKGYESNPSFLDNGGTWGDFQIQFLNEGGESVACYSWAQDYVAGVWQTGEWIEEYNITGESLEVIPAGESVFFTSPTPEAGEFYTLQNAGQVVTKQITTLLAEGTIGLGNPRATNISIDDLVLSGYEENPDFIGNGGTWGDFQIQFLNEGGESVACYSWAQDYVAGAWQAGEWVEEYNDGSVTRTLAPGDGMFVTGAYRYESELYYMSFPAQSL